MKAFVFFAALAVFSTSYAQELPEKMRGEVTDLYCGDLAAYKGGEPGWKQADAVEVKPIGGRCVYFVKAANDKMYGIISSSNSWRMDHVPEGASHAIVIGRTANFSSCEAVEARHAEQIAASGMPKTIQYLNCYPTYTTLEIPADKMLKPTDIAGEYTNRRGDTAVVSVTLNEDEDLFHTPSFSVSVEYTKKENGAEVYVGTDSESVLWFNTERPYFEDSYSDDCDDPDCYNTDGLIRFIQNKNGTYTMYLEFEHYNNAPSEEDSSNDFSEKVHLKRVKSGPEYIDQ